VPDGTIFVLVPFVWRIHAYPNDYWRMSPAAIRSIFPDIGWLKLKFVTDHVQKSTRLDAITSENGHPYLARAETCGFGRRQ
jgi:hypothetical protein